MKLQVTQENLAKALGSVARVANARNSLPILSNVLLKTDGKRLSLSATNLDIAITHTIGAKITRDGSITVPARLMQDFVTSLPSGVINLELEDNHLHITMDKFKSVINGVSAEEYPVMPAINDGRVVSFPAKHFKRALQQVVITSSHDDARPVLTGVYFHTMDGGLYMVATDSYRLSEKKISVAQGDLKFNIPATALQDVLRVIGDIDQDVTLQFDDQQARFVVGEVEIVSRLLEGTYPDYRKLIPSTFATVATLKREDFLNITKVSSLFARESAGSVTLKVSELDKSISIASIASQLGENISTADAEVSGEGEVTLNSRYLLDALNAFSEEEVSFCFNGKLEPCLLRSEQAPDYTHVIMPLKS